jgi:hypothetical protein
LIYSVDYIVDDPDLNDVGGTLHLLVSAPTEAKYLLIRRETLFTQEVAMENGQRIVARTVEGIVDKVTMEAQELRQQMLSKDDYDKLVVAYAEAFAALTERIDDWKQDKRPDGFNTLMDDAVSALRDLYIPPAYLKTVENRKGDETRNVNVVTYMTQAQYDAVPRPIPQGIYCITDGDEEDELNPYIDARIEIHNENAEAHPAIREAVEEAAIVAAAALKPADVVDNLIDGGSAVPLSAEQGKTIRGMILALDVDSKDRGVVRNTFVSQFDTYRVTSVLIPTGIEKGEGYQVGDALFIDQADTQFLFIPATIIVDEVDEDGGVIAVTIGNPGSFETSFGGYAPVGGHGEGLSVDLTMTLGPSPLMADIPNVKISDAVTVLQDETHSGDTWRWMAADYNGDGIVNWVPDHKIDSELRNFIVNPIQSYELAADAVLDSKIGTRALDDEPASGELVPVTAKTLTSWLQSIRNFLKWVKDFCLAKTTPGLGFFKSDGSLGYPTAAQVGLGNVDNTSDVNKPVSTAQGTAIAAAVKTTLEDEPASDALPPLTNERFADLLQATRNNLKWLRDNGGGGGGDTGEIEDALPPFFADRGGLLVAARGGTLIELNVTEQSA